MAHHDVFFFSLLPEIAEGYRFAILVFQAEVRWSFAHGNHPQSRRADPLQRCGNGYSRHALGLYWYYFLVIPQIRSHSSTLYSLHMPANTIIRRSNAISAYYPVW